jgi:hypothetical protein
MGDESHSFERGTWAVADGGPDVTEPDDVDVELAEVRTRLLSTPAEIIVVNHAMGLWELAAIHLAADEPDLTAAALAIDAMAALVDGLGERLGEDATTMRDALSNIRMAFVAITSRA